jgi:acyl-CoA synthetase (AMP-forming)/AMP-acid ligase II
MTVSIRDGFTLGQGLETFGDSPALLTEAGVLSYAALNARVEQAAARLGDNRRLILLEAVNTVDAVTAYLGALRAGHPVILADASRPHLLNELRQRFNADVIITERGWRERRTETVHELHPDLALLLSTSGSTGSPKLVRLSRTNLQSNAEAIATYLNLRPDDRGVTSLPLGYCYGLSVLHSHLLVGAGVLLTGRSVIDPEFWRFAERRGATSFAGVPHTFALLERSHQTWYATPTLRFVTQAGGRLPAEDVRQLSALGQHHRWQFFVMYGQTEATARMAYLPPSETTRHPECVGRAVPGGSLHIDGAGPDGVGELVYRGPNVMMGYAEDPSSLGEGSGPHELRTGDLARQHSSGLFEIVGRRSRFAKLLGQRIDLDRVEGLLAVEDRPVACTSDDRQLHVAVVEGESALMRRRAARLTGLPPGLVSVRQYAELPRLPSGKINYPLLSAGASPVDVATSDLTSALQAAYAQVLGFDGVEPSATFVQLGGDSLCYVEMSICLEELLGTLPANWPELTLTQLAATASRPVAEAPTSAASPAAKPGELAVHDGRLGRIRNVPDKHLRQVDTSVVLRAAAISLIVLVHVDVWGVRGGGHLLLGLAGYTFARFPLAAVRLAGRVKPLIRSLARLAVPSVLFIAAVAAFDDRYPLANVFLVNHVLGPPTWTETWNFWFVEVLVAILLASIALLAVPAVRRFERRHPVALPALVLGAGLLSRYDVFGLSEVSMRFGRPHTVFWIFALGWLVYSVRTMGARLAVSAVIAVTLTGYFPEETVRGLIVQVGLLLVLWLPTLSVPRVLTPALSRIAAASLWIYLTHWIVWPLLLDLGLPRPVVAVACLGVGVLAAAVFDLVQPLLAHSVRSISSRAPSPAPSS